MTGTAIETIDSTERKFNSNDGSQRFCGNQTNNTNAAAPAMFKEFALRQTTGANTTSVNIRTERVTEGSAPTAIVYPHIKTTAMTNCKNVRLVNLRTTKITNPPIKAIWSPLITNT